MVQALADLKATQEMAAADFESEADAEAGASEVEVREARVGYDAQGQRLDKFVVGMAPEFSRSHLQGLIERGLVQVQGQVQKTAARKVLAGQLVRVELQPTEESQAFRAEPMALDIVHEDAHLLVVHKPVGLVVHPAPGNWSGTLMNGLLAHHAQAAHLPRAGIVHRLDKDTSGLMVVGKTLEATAGLSRLIADRDVHREYLALCHGRLADELHIDAPMRRDPASRVKMAVLSGGKAAQTDVYPLAHTAEAPWISAVHCVLHTGRTHQIRVHLAHKGYALLADALYGGTPALGLTRQALHAAKLSFVHPMTGETMVFLAPLPPDLAEAWAQAGFPEPAL
ncbi:RluA family pseudouridine synthase [Pelomonas sp. APW6]|uniref:Pseudouridine synthase n=1 Tax=Roseateles subflavus TaxID=3053353 RepID=A0ABT7LH71_9BURK|nr:RluA family pseudouridine synthase [Pelomonas sp. APW6]MDL5032213.1 RluA family pseudouridine synthase [Pelomonas sp. APW6]